MPANGTPLIQLQGVRKIFFTDEVETHALADVHLEIREGEYVARQAAARRRSSPSSACSIRQATGAICSRTSRLRISRRRNGREFGTGGSASCSRPSI